MPRPRDPSTSVPSGSSTRVVPGGRSFPLPISTLLSARARTGLTRRKEHHMRKRILLIAVPLVIVAIAASVAVASPSDAEHSRGPRLDRLHAERPIAATDSTATLSVTDAGYEKAATDIQNYVTAVNVQEYTTLLQVNDYLRSLGAQVVGEYILSLQAAEAAQAAQAAVPQRVSSAVYSNTYPGDFLSCVRNRESGGNYGVY